MEPTHILDPHDVALALTDFQPSIGTIDGKNKRACPSCKKEFKVERLGEHVKKHHPEFWDALFTVETLEASIKNEDLVKCSIAEDDHDQKFLICLACDSIRTTNRDHFKKNGKTHANQHYEMATKMIAKKKGVAYLPKYKTDLETALTMLDKYKRYHHDCLRDHEDVTCAILDKEELQMELIKTKKELDDVTRIAQRHVKTLNYQRLLFKQIYESIRTTANLMPNTPNFEKLIKGMGVIMEAANEGANM